jgi:type I restriction enzyme R subunit
LTRGDLARLESMLVEAGGSTEEIAKAKQEERSFGLFLRSLVGLDRAAAKQAFSGFIESTTLTANQLEFINIIIDHLTQRGWMEPSLLYESPFTDFSSRGVEGVFAPAQVSQLIGVLESIQRSAVA